MMFEKVAFIGLGLIGSSLARVIRKKGLARQIVAATRSRKTCDDALQLGLIDAGFCQLNEAVKDAEQNCPISKLLNTAISSEAKLA